MVFHSGTAQIYDFSPVLSDETAARTFQCNPLGCCHRCVSSCLPISYGGLLDAGNPFRAQFAFGGHEVEGVSGSGGDQQRNEEHAR